jgi:hypothetical protein
VGSGLPDHRIGIWLLSAFGYTEKLPVYEAAPWTVRYLASLTELTDKKYAAALADIYGRPRVVIDSLPSGWDPSSIFQVDIAKVLGDTLSKTNPVNVRLSDGTNDIPLPTALDTGAFKVREQNPITGFATAANQIIIQAYIDGIETLLAGGLPAALDTGALKTREQNPITGFATQTTLALIAGYVDGLEALLGGGLPAALDTGAFKVKEQNPLTSINVATAGGTNIIIDKLKQSAFTARHEYMIADSTTPTGWLRTDVINTYWGKFYPRGARGHIEHLSVYVRNTAGTNQTISISFATRPGGPRIAGPFVITVNANETGAWYFAYSIGVGRTLILIQQQNNSRLLARHVAE